MTDTRIDGIWDRLKHSLTFRVGTLYAGGSWFLVEATETFDAAPALTRSLATWLAVLFIVLVPAVWYLERRSSRQQDLGEIDLNWGLGVAARMRPRLGGRRGTRAWLTAVAALVVAMGGLWGFGSRLAGGDVPAAATRLAVLPFDGTGSDELREFGRGMVDLLTSALDDVGGIRTIPARTVHARVRAQGQLADMPLDASLQIGRDVGAGSVLLGSVTGIAGNTRLTAEIRSVDGDVLATATVTGPQDSILDLTDQLALELLREMWRSRAPLPTVQVAALTTSSPAALRAYLRGEAYLREVQMDSASHWFGRAIEIDSTFALAWLRRADAVGWYASEDVPVLREYAARGLALAGRLPVREQSFARAENLRLAGSFEAFDSLARYVERYPDDPMGWYKLGDLRYHSGYLGLFTVDEITQPFLEATRLDPSLGIGLHHVIDLARDRGDRPTFDDALERFARVVPPALADRFRSQATVRWAHPDSIITAFTAAIRGIRPDQRFDLNIAVAMVGRRARLDADVDPHVYIEALDSLEHYFGSDPYFRTRSVQLRSFGLSSLGRAEASALEVDRLVTLGANEAPFPAPLLRAMIRINNAITGEWPRSTVESDVQFVVQNDSLDVTGVLEAYYTSIGDLERARRYRSPFELAPQMRHVDTLALRGAYDGWLQAVAGDTLGGLHAMEESIRQLGFMDANDVGLPWSEVGHMLTRVPDRRAQGIRMLHWLTTTTALRTGELYLWLGRAHEAEGDAASAREAYTHVLRLWQGADPFRDDARLEARLALQRLVPDR